MTDLGHNTGIEPELTTKFPKDQLRAIIERIEHIEADIKEYGKDRAEIYLEAKGNGYDVKVLRTIIRMRKMDANDRQEQETVLETYMHALGML